MLHYSAYRPKMQMHFVCNDNFPRWLMQNYSAHMLLYQEVIGTRGINCFHFFVI